MAGFLGLPFCHVFLVVAFLGARWLSHLNNLFFLKVVMVIIAFALSDLVLRQNWPLIDFLLGCRFHAFGDIVGGLVLFLLLLVNAFD